MIISYTSQISMTTEVSKANYYLQEKLVILGQFVIMSTCSRVFDITNITLLFTFKLLAVKPILIH